MAGLSLVTAPVSEPITLADAKAHMNVVSADDDTLITALIKSARSHCESFLNMSLLATVWSYKLDGGFPWEIRLPVGPVVNAAAITITYVDDAGTTQTLLPAEWQASLGETGVIRPAYGKTWPTTRPIMDAVTVTFTAGYGDAADIPPAVIEAVKLALGDFYANRENSSPASISAVPLSARNLMSPFVRHD